MSIIESIWRYATPQGVSTSHFKESPLLLASRHDDLLQYLWIGSTFVTDRLTIVREGQRYPSDTSDPALDFHERQESAELLSFETRKIIGLIAVRSLQYPQPVR